MKPRVPTFRRSMAGMAALALGAVWLSAAVAGDASTSVVTPVAGSPTNSPVADTIPRSVYAIPATAAEGRDPFFPKLAGQSASATPVVKPGEKPRAFELMLQGISGTGGRSLAIISGRSFASGEEGDVLTSGRRITIRCLEIKETSVVIEINGEKRELHLRTPR